MQTVPNFDDLISGKARVDDIRDVDVEDLLLLLGAWGTPQGDVDYNDSTDVLDLLFLLGAWGTCPTS